MWVNSDEYHCYIIQSPAVQGFDALPYIIRSLGKLANLPACLIFTDVGKYALRISFASFGTRQCGKFAS